MEPDTPPVISKVIQKGDAAMVHFSMGEPAWTPSYETASKLELHKPLPDGWTRKQGKVGPIVLPPKPGGRGFQSSWRQSKEGALFESASIALHQEIEEDRRDRRTALMQAVALYGQDDTVNLDVLLGGAEQMYDWLRDHESPAAGQGKASAGSVQADTVGETTRDVEEARADV